MRNFLSFLLVFSFASFGLKTNAQQKFITVKGKEIIDANGKPMLIKGTNLGNWMVPEGYMFKFKDVSSPRLINEAITEAIGPDKTKDFWEKYLNSYVTEADIHYLKSTGMNCIRVPFNYRLFTNETYLGATDENRGFALLDKLIGWSKKEGLYLILDMHAAPGGQTGDNIADDYGYPFLFESEVSQDLTISIWKKIAARYKNEPIVMGYDLLNEPIAHYFDTAKLNPLLEPLYKKITSAIRTVDKNHLIFLGGAQWDGNFSVFGPSFDSKLVYTFHTYWTDVKQEVIQKYIDFRNKNNVPIYIGETGENNDEWIKGFRELLEKNNIGWNYWPYKKMDAKSSIVQFKQPAGYDSLIVYTQKPRTTFAEIRKAAPANRALIEQALNDLLKNCLFENCTPNAGYISGLGLKE
ncbi:glycoside hydrolase family 5 protein [uncultured Mucilaginibacter sp.]|uniref:glycoside hydrolase family 5 protein n=1 Tax=uncultured Mucilaginibacter sp. TaxID=797541 RepID=UPI00262BE047|nr:glycoside hydrolase family 5 protein [uncultured Mucilaginibacter sp.]